MWFESSLWLECGLERYASGLKMIRERIEIVLGVV